MDSFKQLQAIFIIVTAIALLAIVIYFQIQRKRLLAQETLITLELSDTIDLHHRQLKKRQSYLNRYDFLRYNLAEALVVQSEITIL